MSLEYLQTRDEEIHQHGLRTSRVVARFAQVLGIRGLSRNRLVLAAWLHDIGKVRGSLDPYRKQGKLTAEEWEEVQQHPRYAERYLNESAQDFLLPRTYHDVVSMHHEWWDGSGYPYRKVGEQIPMVARIVAIADVFDALTSKRCYRPAWSIDRALAHIASSAGKQFDPALARAFVASFS